MSRAVFMALLMAPLLGWAQVSAPEAAASAAAEAASAPEPAASEAPPAAPPPPPPSCSVLTTRAMSADLRAATAQSQNKDLDALAQLYDEAITQWTATLAGCDGRARDRAQRNLADNQKSRALVAERLAAGSQCEASHRDAHALQELARQAFGDRRWTDAAMLYRKAETMWDLATEHCTGAQQQTATRRREQSEIDAHNAEFCAPLFDRAGDFTRKFRNASAGLPLPERQKQSMIAETLWRETARQCKGSALEQAGNTAQALGRERGTPWVATAPPAPLPAAPAAVAAGKPGSNAAPPAKPGAGVPVAAAVPVPAPVPVPVAAPAPLPTPFSAPSATPPELDVRSGDTRYKGRFVREEGQVVTGTGRVEWSNGDVYEGPLVRNVRTGKGEFVWASGQRYKGDWIDDKATGEGQLRFANGNQYEGTVIDGQPEGQGQMLYASGDLYKGRMKQGVPHGRGLYQWVNGQRYEGDWVDDKPQGQGVLRFSNGNRYEGPVQAGVPHGKGRMAFASGDNYDGHFERGLAQGQGVYVWKTGDRYEGAWQAGRKQGQGLFTWVSGDRWEGLFKDDERTEDGTLTRKEK